MQLEVQYIRGCPNAEEFLVRVRVAVAASRRDVSLREVLVENDKQARRLKFRGSPTLLIDGQDLESAPGLPEAALACRIYRGGLPSVEQIRLAIDGPP